MVATNAEQGTLLQGEHLLRMQETQRLRCEIFPAAAKAHALLIGSYTGFDHRIMDAHEEAILSNPLNHHKKNMQKQVDNTKTLLRAEFATNGPDRPGRALHSDIYEIVGATITAAENPCISSSIAKFNILSRVVQSEEYWWLKDYLAAVVKLFVPEEEGDDLQRMNALYRRNPTKFGVAEPANARA